MAFLDETGLADFWNHILARLNNFVPAEVGKGLSSNDYTTAEKEKLAGIAEGANNYTLPIATSSTLGGVKSGTDITVDNSGNVSVNNGVVTTEKLTDSSVTRAKLAQDALYSPVKTITADRNIEVDDLGKTLKPKYSSSSTTFTLTLNAASSTSLPIGAEIAVCRLYNLNQVNIAFSGVRVVYLAGGRIANKDDNVTVTIPDVGGMLAIKKMEIDSTYGDLWLLTGNAEVVT